MVHTRDGSFEFEPKINRDMDVHASHLLPRHALDILHAIDGGQQQTGISGSFAWILSSGNLIIWKYQEGRDSRVRTLRVPESVVGLDGNTPIFASVLPQTRSSAVTVVVCSAQGALAAWIDASYLSEPVLCQIMPSSSATATPQSSAITSFSAAVPQESTGSVPVFVATAGDQAGRPTGSPAWAAHGSMGGAWAHGSSIMVPYNHPLGWLQQASKHTLNSTLNPCCTPYGLDIAPHSLTLIRHLTTTSRRCRRQLDSRPRQRSGPANEAHSCRWPDPSGWGCAPWERLRRSRRQGRCGGAQRPGIRPELGLHRGV